MDIASRRGAANLATPLMIAAFVIIGAFIYWLSVRVEGEMAARAVPEEEVEEVASTSSLGGTLIPGENLQRDASPYVGQVVRLEGLAVASPLGTQGFWLELPNGNPFLVSVSEAARADGMAQPGQVVTVVGLVSSMGDSVLTAWATAATVNEGDRLAAEFASHYLEAEAVQVTGDTATAAAPGAGN